MTFDQFKKIVWDFIEAYHPGHFHVQMNKETLTSIVQGVPVYYLGVNDSNKEHPNYLLYNVTVFINQQIPDNKVYCFIGDKPEKVT